MDERMSIVFVEALPEVGDNSRVYALKVDDNPDDIYYKLYYYKSGSFVQIPTAPTPVEPEAVTVKYVAALPTAGAANVLYAVIESSKLVFKEYVEGSWVERALV